MGRLMVAVAMMLLLVAAQGFVAQAQELNVQEERRRMIERGSLLIAQGFYPNGLDSINVAPEIVTFLGDELVAAGQGGVERAYCLFGRITQVHPGLWIEIDSIYRSPELGEADSVKMTPLPCPPEALGRAHLHTAPPDKLDLQPMIFWSRLDGVSFKTRTSVFGTVYYFDMIVGWTNEGPTWAVWSWDELAEWEAQPGVDFYVVPHEYIRAGLLHHHGVDIDTLYVERK